MKSITEEFSDQKSLSRYDFYDQIESQSLNNTDHVDLFSFISPTQGGYEYESWSYTGRTTFLQFNTTNGIKNIYSSLQTGSSGDLFTLSGVARSTVDISDYDFLSMSFSNFPWNSVSDGWGVHISSDPSGGMDPSLTSFIPFSDSINPPLGWFEFKVRIEDIESGADFSKIKSVHVSLGPLSSTGIGMVLSSVRAVNEGFQVGPLMVNTVDGTLRRGTPLSANLPDLNTFRYAWDADNIFWLSKGMSISDPRPIDVGVDATISNRPKASGEDPGGSFSLYYRELTEDFLTQLDLNGYPQSFFNGKIQPDVGDAMWDPRTQEMLEDTPQLAEDGFFLEGSTQYFLERIPDYVSSSYIHNTLEWENDGPNTNYTLSIGTTESTPYTYLFSGSSTAGRDLIMSTSLEDTSMRVKVYSVLNLSTEIQTKDPVYVASTGSVNLPSPSSAIDGVSYASIPIGSRVLLKNQSSPRENGIYTKTGSGLVRSSDANSWSELVSASVEVTNGTSQANTYWVCDIVPGSEIGVGFIFWTQSLTKNPLDPTLLFDTRRIQDSFLFKRRKGRFGWKADLGDYGSIKSIRSNGSTVYAEYISEQIKTDTPIDGAELFVSCTPDEELFETVSPSPTNEEESITIHSDSSRSKSKQSWRVENVGGHQDQGVVTNQFFIESFRSIQTDFDIYYPSGLLSVGESISIYIVDERGSRTKLVTPSLTGDVWQTVRVDLRNTDTFAGRYRILIVQDGSSKATWWIDNISIRNRAIEWSGRSVADDAWKSNPADWQPYRDIKNGESYGILFDDRGRELQTRARSLRSDGEINRIQVVPKFSELGKFVFNEDEFSGVPPVVSINPIIPVNDRLLTYEFSSTKTSSYASNESMITIWYFGDGKRSVGDRVYHKYANAGRFNVTVVVIDPRGNSSSETREFFAS